MMTSLESFLTERRHAAMAKGSPHYTGTPSLYVPAGNAPAWAKGNTYAQCFGVKDERVMQPILSASNSAGLRLLLSPGDYHIQTTLALPATSLVRRLIIQGAGMGDENGAGGTRIYVDQTDSTDGFLSSGTAAVEFRDLSIIGNASAQHGIHLNGAGSTRPRFVRVLTKGFTAGSGIKLVDTPESYFECCISDGNSIGYEIDGGSSVVLNRCDALNNTTENLFVGDPSSNMGAVLVLGGAWQHGASVVDTARLMVFENVYGLSLQGCFLEDGRTTRNAPLLYIGGTIPSGGDRLQGAVIEGCDINGGSIATASAMRYLLELNGVLGCVVKGNRLNVGTYANSSVAEITQYSQDVEWGPNFVNGTNIYPTVHASALPTFRAYRSTGQGADVASANDLTLSSFSPAFEITGTTQINAITTAGWYNGDKVTLLFTSTPTVKHNTAGGAGTAVILLAGAVDFSATAGDTLPLMLSEIGGVQAWRQEGGAVI